MIQCMSALCCVTQQVLFVFKNRVVMVSRALVSPTWLSYANSCKTRHFFRDLDDMNEDVSVFP